MIIKLTEAPQQIEAPSNSVSIVDLLKQAYEKGLFKKLKCDGRKNAVRMDISGLDKDRLIAYFDKRSEFNREDNTESGIHSAEFISDEFDIEIFDSFIQIYKLIDTEAIRKLTKDDLEKLINEGNNAETHNIDDIVDIVSDQFGITAEPYRGPTFILPNGYFLNLKNCKHHSDVEKYLINAGLSNNEYIVTAGSKTLADLGCIRCDTTKYYIALANNVQPTGKQYNSLLLWLDALQHFGCKSVEVITDDNQHIMYYFDGDTISDTVVDRIRKYYYSGKLLEASDVEQKHQHDFVYERHSAGTTIMPVDRNKVRMTRTFTESDTDRAKLQINEHAYDEICRKVEQQVMNGERKVIAVDVDEWFDMMDKYQLKELDNLTKDISQGTGNVVVYYGYNPEDNKVYKYASY